MIEELQTPHVLHVKIGQNQLNARILPQNLESLKARPGKEQLLGPSPNLSTHPLPEHGLNFWLIVHHQHPTRQSVVCHLYLLHIRRILKQRAPLFYGAP